jgi:biotin-(acetyl-CoA carboxylase) ligase
VSHIQWSMTATSGSVIERAEELVSEGAPQGTVVRSRALRRLELCAILTPARRTHLQMLQILAPYSTAEGIRKDTGLVAWLRWPHWVTVDGRVLAEGSARVITRRGESRVLLESKVNCWSSTDEASTSLQALLGVRVDRNLLTERILDSLTWVYSAWHQGMDGSIRARIEPTIEEIGTSVSVALRGRRVLCIARGLGEDGSLRLRHDGKNVILQVRSAKRALYQ